MRFLTIVERELRVNARRRSTYRTRLGGGLFGFCILLFTTATFQSNASRNLGTALFSGLSILGFILASWSGFASTSDCMSEEKREGTLGLLFLTQLKGVDVVAGKLVASGIHSVYALMGLFPILAISFLAGGVSISAFLMAFVAAMNLMFLSLSVGMMCSAIFREARTSFAVAAGVLFLLCIGVPLLALLLIEYYRFNSMESWLLYIWPLSPCLSALEAVWGTASGGPWTFQTSLLITNAIAWIFLWMAIRHVGHAWQDEALKSSSPRTTPANKGSAEVAEESERTRRSSWLDTNPYFWRSAWPFKKKPWIWGGLILLTATFGVGVLMWPEILRETGSYFFWSACLHGLLKLMLVLECSSIFAEDLQTGAFELLLVTPLKPKEIVDGFRRSLWYLFAGPFFAVLLFDILVLLFQKGQRENDYTMLRYLLGVAVLSMADMVAISWFTPAQSLRTRKPNQAIAITIGLILVVPWLSSVILMGIASVLAMHGYISFTSIREHSFESLWIISSLVADGMAVLIGRRILPHQLQSAAASRYQPVKESGV